MYKIIKDGEIVGFVDKLHYIRKHENGCFVEADEETADGIVVSGTAYRLVGHKMEGAAGEVIAVEVDAGAELAALQAENAQLKGENEMLMMALTEAFEEHDDVINTVMLALVELDEKIAGG